MFRTRHIRLSPLKLEDSASILEIRRSTRGRTLQPTSARLADQELYMNEYEKRFNSGIEIYFGITLLASPGRLSGLVRVTELDNKTNFNWASLVTRSEIPPFVPLDVMLAVYGIGFEFFDKESCGPFPVRSDVPRVLELHMKMGMSVVHAASHDTTYLVTTRELFLAKIEKYRNLGFGEINLESR